MTRAGRHRLLRNAIAALGNVESPPPVAEALLRRAAEDRRPELREQAQRVLTRYIGLSAPGQPPRLG
jgi:epoxyqueuosine reductase QueG